MINLARADLIPRPRIFAAAAVALAVAGLGQQMAEAVVETDSFVPINKVVTINRPPADTRPPSVEFSGFSRRANTD